jgi:hypothetical protein
MDSSDILTLFSYKVKNPKSSKLKTKAKGRRLILYQVKILVAVLRAIVGEAYYTIKGDSLQIRYKGNNTNVIF